MVPTKILKTYQHFTTKIGRKMEMMTDLGTQKLLTLNFIHKTTKFLPAKFQIKSKTVHFWSIFAFWFRPVLWTFSKICSKQECCQKVAVFSLLTLSCIQKTAKLGYTLVICMKTVATCCNTWNDPKQTSR